LPALVTKIREVLEPTGWGYEVILVNDFSPDRSWEVVESLCRADSHVVGVDLRRNFGQDNAIMTGLRLARGAFVAIMDDDMQHHPKYLPSLVSKLEEGPDVVYADFSVKRQKWWKNFGSWANGKIAELVLYKPRDIYLSPYKVIRREVVEIICQYSGPTPYIDGLLFQVTWRVAKIPAGHYPRYAGQSNYRFWRSLGISARLAFSYSVKPLRFVTYCGLFLAAAGLLSAVVVVLYRLLFPQDFPATAVGWASLMVTFLFVSGVEMVFFGVLGEYVGRTYLRVNDKPQTSVRMVLNRDRRGQSAPGRPNGTSAEINFGTKSPL
jgi:undecaprenyl-phosphate 4-deoxy-4-formamido-L-arabinose transferase